MSVFNKVKSGIVTPEEALRQFESPGKALFSISPSKTRQSLPVGISSIEAAQYICADQPNLVIIAARPGFGKSALLFQLAYNVAKTGPVDLYSLEMDESEVKSRIIAQQAQMHIDRFKQLPEAEQMRILSVMDVPLYVDATSGLQLNQLISRSKARAKNGGLKAIFVDYLQIVSTGGDSWGTTTADKIAGVARALKTLAKDLQVPVVCAAQMNRNMDARLSTSKHKPLIRPSMSDISDSAGIEKWADVVMFLHREYNGDIANPRDIMVTVSKNRHGPMQDFRLEFRGAESRFLDRGYVEEGL